jgi:hypothetical protein
MFLTVIEKVDCLLPIFSGPNPLLFAEKWRKWSKHPEWTNDRHIPPKKTGTYHA